MEPTLQRSLEVLVGAAAPTLPGAAPGQVQPGTTASPTPSPTPGGPTATPSPAGTPGSVAELARQADAAYQRAQEALRRGDFATYGAEIARVQQLIQQLVQQTGP